MPFTSVLIVAGIVSAFAAFGLVLAWGDHQTRHLSRKGAVPEPKQAGRPDDTKLAA